MKATAQSFSERAEDGHSGLIYQTARIQTK
jgi:hypothetical protein